jgi:transcription elongation factor GreA
MERIAMEFVTPDEFEQIKQKLEERKSQRAVLSERIAEARALGDLKENAEYHAARDDQGLNEAEIRRLEERLSSVAVTSEGAVPKDIVFVGSVVKLRDTGDASEDVYKIVGESTGAFNFDSDEIEVTSSSPMGVALIKARVGDTIKVDLPRGTKRFEVIEIL